MHINPMARVLKNSVLKGAAGRNAAGALNRGVEVAGQVGASASEFLRVRRDPAEVARRRRRAAVRRSNIWGAGSAIGIAAGAALTVNVVDHGVTASSVFSLVLVVALIVWCLLGLARSATDLRLRNRAVKALPPPQPARRTVAPQIRSDVGRLDLFSDGLRDLLSMLPIDAADGLSTVRLDVIASADEAERLLRRQAQEYTLLRKTAGSAPRQARPALDGTAASMAGQIHAGVLQYGQLVAAATDTVAASAALQAAVADLQPATDRLRALAMGMREIAEHARPPQGPTG
jgi:hypothetical protein